MISSSAVSSSFLSCNLLLRSEALSHRVDAALAIPSLSPHIRSRIARAHTRVWNGLPLGTRSVIEARHRPHRRFNVGVATLSNTMMMSKRQRTDEGPEDHAMVMRGDMGGGSAAQYRATGSSAIHGGHVAAAAGPHTSMHVAGHVDSSTARWEHSNSSSSVQPMHVSSDVMHMHPADRRSLLYDVLAVPARRNPCCDVDPLTCSCFVSSSDTLLCCVTHVLQE